MAYNAAVISDLIGRYRSLIRLFPLIRGFLHKAFIHRTFAKITVEFLTEVAVLVLVFPTLDTIINKGQSKVTLPLVIGSLLVTVLCLFLAGIISMLARGDTGDGED